MATRNLNSMLWKHFRQHSERLSIVTEEFEQSDHPNLQRALEAYVGQGERSWEVVGWNEYEGVSEILQPIRLPLRERKKPCPARHVTYHLDEDETISCAQSALILIVDDTNPLAAVVEEGGGRAIGVTILLHVMARKRELAEQFLREIRALMRQHSVYRGKILSFSSKASGGGFKCHPLPEVRREQIILPENLLQRIDRATLGFSAQGDRLRRAGRHLKRGLLLHGPPGNGKTLTAMYLASQMRGRTVVVLTGESMRFLERMCGFARLLQPSTIIIEDVDLIAEERTSAPPTCNTLLFELLNQMDGMAEDADVLFLLTTNRPDLLEPALAARPGRIDQAFELPLPDADCRRRLIELYGAGLTLRLPNLEAIVHQTEGASAAFIRELLRKAALFAAEDNKEMIVTERHLHEAVHELLCAGGKLTRSLLGASRAGFQEPP